MPNRNVCRRRIRITALKEFIIFISPAKKLSRQGRRSGGVVVCVRKCFAHLFRQVTVKFDNFIVLESSKALLNTDKDVLFIFVYIPPSGSPAYAQTANGVGVEQIVGLHVWRFQCSDKPGKRKGST